MGRWFWFVFSSSCFCFAGQERIYDCFLFFNELDVLEIRLSELYDHVDYFVLVEATESFQGNPKPLYFEKNKQRFQKYLDKIIHVIVRDRMRSNNPWDRESFQRNQIVRGLRSCSKNDVIIISDVDEIIRNADLQRFIFPVLYQDAEMASAKLQMYRFFFNRRDVQIPFWIGPVAIKWKHLLKMSPEEARTKGRSCSICHGFDCGWHFSSMGGFNCFLQKIASFSHTEANTPENRDPVKVYQYVMRSFALVPVDFSFPKLIQEHQQEFFQKGLLDYEGNLNYK